MQMTQFELEYRLRFMRNFQGLIYQVSLHLKPSFRNVCQIQSGFLIDKSIESLPLYNY